jgi:hypothetical protein
VHSWKFQKNEIIIDGLGIVDGPLRSQCLADRVRQPCKSVKNTPLPFAAFVVME